MTAPTPNLIAPLPCALCGGRGVDPFGWGTPCHCALERREAFRRTLYAAGYETPPSRWRRVIPINRPPAEYHQQARAIDVHRPERWPG